MAIKLWDAASGREQRTLTGHKGEIDAIAFSPDGRTIASGSEDRTIRLWDAASGRELRILAGHTGRVRAIAFSPDGRTLISGSWDNTLKLWDTASGRNCRRTLAGHSDAISANGVAVSPDGRTVVSGSLDKTIKFWDAASGRELRSLKGHSGAVLSVAFSPDGRNIVSASGDSTLKLWDASSGRQLRTLTGHAGKVVTAAFSPDGAMIASGGFDLTIRLWDAPEGRELRTLAARGIVGPTAAFLPDGRTIAGGVKLWDAANGRGLRTLPGNTDGHRAVSFSPDGRTIASSPDKTVKLWDAANGRELHTFAGHSMLVLSLAYSPDGRTLLSGGYDKIIKRWDVSSGRELRAFGGHGFMVGALAFSPDGRTIVSGGAEREPTERDDGRIAFGEALVKLWDAASGRELRRLQGHRISVQTVAFSPDGRTIASGSEDQTTKLWDAASGQELRTLTGHGAGVSAVRFSPDGRKIVTASGDHTLKLWDAATGRELHTFAGHVGPVWNVAFSPDGQTIVSASGDRTIRRWSLDGDLLVTMIASDNGEWLTITPEGFFDASQRGAEILSVVRGFEVYSIDQVYQALYRPDLVGEKLAGDPKGLVREAAANFDLSKVMQSGEAPHARILPVGGTDIKENEIVVEAEITNRGGGIGTVEWRVNGVTLGINARGLARAESAGAPASKTLTVRQALSLDPGENTIEVVAYNAKGLIASSPANVKIVREVPQMAARPRLHVLAIGVNDYWDSRLQLKYAVPDAEALAAALPRTGEKLYESVEITTVLDAGATAANLDRVFGELGRKVRSEDVFLFFIAGHGKTVSGRYYFLPQDFRYEGEESIIARGISQERWQEWFARIRARKSVLLYDTCESGTLTGDRVAERGLERVAAVDRMTRAMGALCSPLRLMTRPRSKAIAAMAYSPMPCLTHWTERMRMVMD